MKAVALMLMLTGCGCTSIPMETMHRTTLRLESATGICSGTAIGPHQILTATHCLAHPLLTVNGKRIEVTGRRDSSRDTSEVTVTGITFPHWSQRGHKPKQGDRVKWWGNPEGVADVYREGYVAAVQGDAIAIDATICHGDSGSGLFNTRGEVVAVISAMTDANGCTFLVAWK